MPKIDISDLLNRRLLRRATSFEDTAEDVINRLLEEVGDSSEITVRDPQPAGPAGRAAPGSVLPVEGYWIPILHVLSEAGGSAPSIDVIEALETRMRDVLTQRDFEPLKSGEIRWRNRARFARLRMKERGLLSETSHRGVWEITELGREYLKHADGGSED
jgi:hypothetical protein